jgi:predicted metal-binding protein
VEAHRVRKVVRSNWERALLVCGKCTAKLDGGFGVKGRIPLGKALRKELGVGRGRKARIGVAGVKCLGLCPKRAVVAIDTAHPGRWHVIPAGTAIAEVARTVLGDAVDSGPPVQVTLALTEVTEVVVLPDQAAPA